MRNLAPGCCPRVVHSCPPIAARACQPVVFVPRDVAARLVNGAPSRTKSGTRTRALAGGQDDHYRMLGVSRSATSQDIKIAFRQRARQCHPDVNRELGAGDQFKSIRLAYEILLDDAKRREYDASLAGGATKRRRPRARSQAGYRSRYAQYTKVTHRPSEWAAAANAPPAEGRGSRAASTAKADGKGAAPEDRNDPPKDTAAAVERNPLQLREAAVGLWIVAVAWHAFGAHTALTLLVAVMSMSKQLAVGYRVASGVAWLIGGEKGLLVAASVSVTTLVFGKPQSTAAAIVALALWLGGSLMQALPFPPGAVLVMAYKCIELQAELELVA